MAGSTQTRRAEKHAVTGAHGGRHEEGMGAVLWLLIAFVAATLAIGLLICCSR
jgi:hypothetical protein